MIYRIPLEGGPAIWFKANPPASRYEPALLQALSAWRPTDVLSPLAIDADRGWSLQPDGGPTFAEFLDHDPNASIRDWESVVRQYAEFQRAVAAHTDQIAAVGVPLRPTSQAPDLFRRLVDEAVALPEADRLRLKALTPEFADWCAVLVALGVPETLDHADLHEAQILGPDRDGRYRFFDWGDAAIGHPFASLRVTLDMIRDRYGPDTDLARLRDVYLESWTDCGVGMDDLRRSAALAYRVGVIGRVLALGRLFEEHLSGSSVSFDQLVAESLTAALTDSAAF